MTVIQVVQAQAGMRSSPQILSAPRRDARTAVLCLRPRRTVHVITLLLALLSFASVRAAPVDADQARRAGETFVTLRYPARDPRLARTRTGSGSSELRVKRTVPLFRAGKSVGFVNELEPAGYVLMRADDQAPPVKLHSDQGRFDQLPPAFLEVIKAELAEELTALEAQRAANRPQGLTYPARWTGLVNAEVSTDLQPEAPGVNEGKVLLETSWNQFPPYNYYCPQNENLTGQVPPGCTATALAQIQRYHRQPAAVVRDHRYQDDSGTCLGWHAMSDAGLEPYRWDLMPSALDSNSSTEQIQAVAQLLFHAAVALEANFEWTGTGAWPSSAALFKEFGYVSSGYAERALGYTSAQWYNKIAADIDASRPILYVLAQADGTGSHSVVCDGYRNGNEIHLNLGWAITGTAWYNMEEAIEPGFGYTWTMHKAIFGITPPAATELAPPLLNPEPETTKGPRNTVSWQPMTGVDPVLPASGIAASPGMPSPTLVTSQILPALASQVAVQATDAGLPNLAPYQPPGWSDAIVVAIRPVTRANEAPYDDELVYVSYAMINNGTAPTPTEVHASIYLDGVLKFENQEGNNWAPGSARTSDLYWGKLSAGTHTITLRIDPSNQLAEQSETDNEYTRTVTVLPTAEVEYRVEAADNPEFLLPCTSGWLWAVQDTFSDLLPGVTYWYRVKARRAGVESPWSSPEHSQQLLTGILALSGDLAFGDVKMGTSAMRTLRIGNIGEAPLNVTRITLPSIAFSSEGWAGEIPAGGFQDVAITFGGVPAGSYTGNVVVSSDAMSGSDTIPTSGVSRRGYDYWRDDWFSAADRADPLKEATVWGASADPDGDGWANLMEYALGTDPNTPEVDTTAIQLLPDAGPYLRIGFKRRLNRSDIDYVVEASGDCQTWSSVWVPWWSDTGQAIPGEPEFEWMERQDSTAANVGGPRFIRLSITQR